MAQVVRLGAHLGHVDGLGHYDRSRDGEVAPSPRGGGRRGGGGLGSDGGRVVATAQAVVATVTWNNISISRIISVTVLP